MTQAMSATSAVMTDPDFDAKFDQIASYWREATSAGR